MESTSIIYYVKLSLGVVVAIICALLNVTLLMGITIGVFTYFVSDRILRQVFIDKIDKPLTVTKTGIGIYILSWVFFWVLLFTFLYPPV